IQGQGRERIAFAQVPAYELRGQVLSIGGTASIAKENRLSATLVGRNQRVSGGQDGRNTVFEKGIVNLQAAFEISADDLGAAHARAGLDSSTISIYRDPHRCRQWADRLASPSQRQ